MTAINFQDVKIVPLKSEKEKELFAKWKHVLKLKNISKQMVEAYNSDLKDLLQYNKDQKQKLK